MVAASSAAATAATAASTAGGHDLGLATITIWTPTSIPRHQSSATPATISAAAASDLTSTRHDRLRGGRDPGRRGGHNLSLCSHKLLQRPPLPRPPWPVPGASAAAVAVAARAIATTATTGRRDAPPHPRRSHHRSVRCLSRRERRVYRCVLPCSVCPVTPRSAMLLFSSARPDGTALRTTPEERRGRRLSLQERGLYRHVPSRSIRATRAATPNLATPHFASHHPAVPPWRARPWH